jgi:serine O-acetyltransferase
MRRFIYDFFFSYSHKVITLYSRGHYFSKLPSPLCYIREFYRNKIAFKFGCYISPKALISKDIKFPHPVGIIIGDGVEIGTGCTIYQGVTLGAGRKGEGKLNKYPTIGRNVIIYSGAVIIGDVKVGDNSVIGANSVVIKNVPENSVAVGVPSRVITKNE